MMGIVRKYRDSGSAETVEMPLAKVATRIARIAQSLGNGFLLEAKGITVSLHPGAIIGASCEHCGATGGAIGGTGVKAIKAQPPGRHGVEMWRLEMGVTVVAGLAPPLIVSHDEDNVRWIVCEDACGEQGSKEQKKGRFHGFASGESQCYNDPMKPSIHFFSVILASTALASSTYADHHAAKHNTLTAKEKADGWKLLFNGKDLSSWRNYQADGINEKWKIEGDTFILTAKGGGDIVTHDQYGAFELKIDFKISPKGNSGVMFHVQETEQKAWRTGPEIQIQDHAHGKDPQKAGWLPQLYKTDVDAANPAGEWNTIHILITPEKCEHYMNGTKYFEYVKGSEDWNKRVAASKFSKYPSFGKPARGHICLQDHGNVVHFRNVKIKLLD